jgi:hypothetical protein
LDDKLHSSEYVSIRKAAAKKLLKNKKPNLELEAILELLSTISFLYDRKAIDKELTYKQFSYWIDRYWLTGKQNVEDESRKYDPQSYITLEKIANIFIKTELKSGYPPFSEEILRSFLNEEAQLPKRV